ncbi:MAG: 5-dehydro-2-deoxygluconokinase [Gammaproteobacteria bacterium]|nr:5-dehydro-2-deoxygluconokinase [Gammaproteobacteria bacterium]
MPKKIDLITIGRSCVDLYGTQVGGRLEDMRSFDKYIGGSPTNIAVGAARLGLKSALISRVGNEHMGRFICEQLFAEGVNAKHVNTDPKRLTALVMLGIRDKDQFPLIFFRENCADMALCEEDIDPDFIASARCICATGTHLSNPLVEAATLKALRLARDNDSKTALDIDYRPNLWGVAGHSDGENRFIKSKKVTSKLQSTLHLFDLIVGTEEEFHIAGGTTDTLQAIRNVRSKTDAVLICKQGPMGARAFINKNINNLDDGISGSAFPIEVFNVLGAGDGFISGLFKGWLNNEDWQTALTYANACGALAVSRHGCAPSYPSWEELNFFLNRGVKNPVLRKDSDLEQMHWSTNRINEWSDMKILSCDNFSQTEMSNDLDKRKAISFKHLCLKSISEVSDGKPSYGLICDTHIGQSILSKAVGQNLWIGSSIELSANESLDLDPEIGENFGGLSQLPHNYVVKFSCFCYLEDDQELQLEQEKRVIKLFKECRRNRLEFLIEIISLNENYCPDKETIKLIQKFYDLGIHPDWWMINSFRTNEFWQNINDLIIKKDKHIRGILVKGLDLPLNNLISHYKIAAKQHFVKGFVIENTVYGNTYNEWIAGNITDNKAIQEIANKYKMHCSAWQQACSEKSKAK